MYQSQRVPEPRAELWDWQHRGRCREFGPVMFFGDEGEDRRSRVRRIAQAKQICGGCPVLMSCRAQALDFAEQHGVWGGLTPGERSAILVAARTSGDHADAASADSVANKSFR